LLLALFASLAEIGYCGCPANVAPNTVIDGITFSSGRPGGTVTHGSYGLVWQEVSFKAPGDTTDTRNYCVGYSTARLTPDEGEQVCQQYGAHLPSIHSYEEFVTTYGICACPGGSCNSNAFCLIGFRDDQVYSPDAFESTYTVSTYNGVTYPGAPWRGAQEQYNGGQVGPPGWRWTDNTEVDYTHWNSGEPNDWSNHNPGEDCVELWTRSGTAAWNDIFCDGIARGGGFQLRAYLLCKVPSGCDRGLFQGDTGCEQCPPGSYQDSPDGEECILCPAGTFGDSYAAEVASCAGTCELGHYCPIGSTSSTQVQCPAGRYGDTRGRENEACSGDCAAGYFCGIGTTVSMPSTQRCEAGRFGTAGQTTDQCTGKCAAGYYCELGSADQNQNACGGANVYCIAGSAAPTTVRAGYYSTGGAATTRTGESPCSVGYYCVDGERTLCPAGKYGGNEELTSAGCTDPDNCPGGDDPLTACQFCFAGFYCTAGASSPSQSACGAESGAGVYCEEGSSAPVDIPSGSYTTPESSSPLFRTGATECESGYYCYGKLPNAAFPGIDPSNSGLRLPLISFTGDSCTDFSLDEGVTAATQVGTLTVDHLLDYTVGFSISSVVPVSTTQHTCAESATPGLFAIDSGSGEITLGATLEYLPASGGCPSYTVTFDVSDSPSDPTTIVQCVSTVSVADLNDAPEVDDNQVFYILERSEVDTLVTADVSGTGDPAPIIAEDPDPGQELLFDFEDCQSSTTVSCDGADNTPNPLRSVFQIGFCTGQISLLVGDLSYDDPECNYVNGFCKYEIPIVIRDSSFPVQIVTTTITVNVVNINDPPSFNPDVNRFTYFSVNENSDVRSTHGDGKQRVAPDTESVPWAEFALDPDGDDLVFTVLSSEEGVAITIETDDGDGMLYLFVDGVINFEFRGILEIQLTVSDAEFDVTESFLINVVDVNDPPYLADSFFSVDENVENSTPNGTPIGGELRLAVLDEDAGEFVASFIFSLVEANSYFTVDTNTGQVSVNGLEIDFEAIGTIAGDAFPSCTGLEGSDCNDASGQSTCACGIDGSCCGADAFAAGTDCSANTEGACSACQTCNPDPRGRDIVVELRVAVTDQQVSVPINSVVSITINDVNEPPSFINQMVDILENAADNLEIIPDLQMFADSGDALAYPDQLVSFFLAENNDDAIADMFYLVSGINTVSLFFRSGELDFESMDTTYTLNLQIRDSASAGLALDFVDGVVTINVKNVNEPPVWSSSVARYVAEEAIATTVASHISDPSLNGLANEVVDPDQGETTENCCKDVTFAITGGAGSDSFVLVGDEIQVANGASLDHESDPNIFLLEISATNSDGLSATATVRVFVTDVEEQPIIENGGATFFASQQDLAGTVMGFVEATDPDSGYVLQYTITGCGYIHPLYDVADGETWGQDGTGCWFQIDLSGTDNCASGGVCGGTVRLNYGDGDVGSPQLDDAVTYTLTVEVSDSITSPVSADFTLDILDVSAAPIYTGDTSGSVPENDDSGPLVANLVGTDADDDSITFTPYEVVYTSAGLETIILYDANDPGSFPFTVSVAQPCANPCQLATLRMTAGNTFDYEEVSQYSVTLQMADTSASQRSSFVTVEVAVTNVNERPIFTSFDNELALPESAQNGDVVGTVSAVDPDVGDIFEPTDGYPLIYSLSGEFGNIFAINANTGVVTVSNAGFDYESGDTRYTLTITATDKDSTPLSDITNFDVLIINVNEAPSADDVSIPMSEVTASGSVLGQVVVTDPDVTNGDILGLYTFEIVSSSNLDGLFTIAETGVISLATDQVLDYEALNGNVHTLQIRVTDQPTAQTGSPYNMPAQYCNSWNEERTCTDEVFQPQHSVISTFTINVLDADDVTVDSVSPDSFSTQFPETVYLVGTNFGTLRQSPTLVVTYANSDYSYTATGCALQDGLNLRIACTTVPGHGGAGYVWTVTVSGDSAGVGQSTDTTAFDGPTITSVTSGLSETTGGTIVDIMGTNFGLMGNTITAYYGDTQESCPASGTCIVTGDFRYTAVECSVTLSHTTAQCKTIAGVGSGLAWVVTIEGAESADSFSRTAYKPPSLQSLVYDSVSTDNGDQVLLSVNGGEVVRLIGANFGSDDTPANVLSVSYGPYTATNCVYFASHVQVDCETIAGAGFDHQWTVSVKGQDSEASSFTTSYRTQITAICVDDPAVVQANPAAVCTAALIGSSDGSDENGQPLAVSIKGVNFGSSLAARTVFFGQLDVDGVLTDCCPQATAVDVSTAACALGLVCSETLLQFYLPEGSGLNVPVSVLIVEPDSRRLDASDNDHRFVTFSPASLKGSVASFDPVLFAGRRTAQSEFNTDFSYATPMLNNDYGSTVSGLFYPYIYDYNGNLRTSFPRSGCYDDNYGRDPATQELICNDPVLLRIGGSSLGSAASAEGIIKFHDPITDEVKGTCLPKCICPVGDGSGGAADCGWAFGCKHTHNEIICQVLPGKGSNNLIVATVGGSDSTYESVQLYFSYDGPIVERVYPQTEGIANVAADFDISISSCDTADESCVDGTQASILYSGDDGETRAISTRWTQYLRNYGYAAYDLSYNALGFEASEQPLEIYGQNFGREESEIYITLNGKVCTEALWNNGEDFLGSPRFPSYLTCKAPADVAGPKSAVVSVAGQNWTQEVLSTTDVAGQRWYEGNAVSGLREIPQTSEDYVPAVYVFNSICKNDTLLFDSRGTPSLDIYYGRPNEECTACPDGANCFALGYLDPISQYGFWRTYFNAEAEEATNENIGCPEERRNRAEGTCPVFQACLPLESCEGNNQCAEGYQWQKFACEDFYTANPDRVACTTNQDCRCDRDRDGNVNLDSCLGDYSECSDADPQRCSMCVEGTCTCQSASRCSLCTAREFFRIDGECEPCPTNVIFLIVLFFCALVGCAVGGYVLNKKQFNLAFISIGVDYFQVLAIFATADIEWPQQLLDLFRLFSVFNFNIDITAPECVVPDLPFSVKWYGTMFLPMGCFGVLLCVHVYNIVRKVADGRRSDLNKHVHILVAAMFTAMYYMYLTLTRKALDIFNCNPVVPDDGYTYTVFTSIECDGGLCRCWEEGGLQLSLVPTAAILFCLYSVGYPLTVFMILRKNKDLIKEDQLLRAKEVGNDRISNPNAYEVRKKYHKLYYHFKPGKTYWVTYIICRKFGIAVSALLFRDNPSFQLSMVLLVLFCSYILQVQHRPYMSSAEREEVLAHHRAKIDSGSRADIQKHLELESRLKAIDEKIAHERRLKGNTGKFDDLDDSYAISKKAKKFFFDFNTVEQTLLACAILVCLAGIMFESPRFEERDDLQWQKDTLTYLIILVIVFSIVYYFSIFVSEFLEATGYKTLKFFKIFMSRKYRERASSTSQIEKDQDANLDTQANPLLYAKDLEAAEHTAELTGRRAEELASEVQSLKDLNETLVREVNDAKKREATAKLSHFSSHSEMGKKKGSKKKKKFGGKKDDVDDGDEKTRKKSIFDSVADKMNAARRAPEKEIADVEMIDIEKSTGDEM